MRSGCLCPSAAGNQQESRKITTCQILCHKHLCWRCKDALPATQSMPGTDRFHVLQIVLVIAYINNACHGSMQNCLSVRSGQQPTLPTSHLDMLQCFFARAALRHAIRCNSAQATRWRCVQADHLTVARVPSSRLPSHHNCRLHMIMPKSPIAVVSEPNSCKHFRYSDKGANMANRQATQALHWAVCSAACCRTAPSANCTDLPPCAIYIHCPDASSAADIKHQAGRHWILSTASILPL